MKKRLIDFVLLCFCISCNSMQPENEEILPIGKILTRTSEPDSYTLAITTNLEEELILFPTIYPYEGIPINKEIVFRHKYVDTLSNGDSFWVMPYPVKGKKWVGIEGDFTKYDTSLDNEVGCPYFEGFVNNRNLNIYLTYEDSIPHTGGSTGGSGSHPGGNPEEKPEEKPNPVMILSLYHAYTRSDLYGGYELVFKMHSGIFTPDGTIEMNPMYGDPILVEYDLQEQPRKTTNLTPVTDYYVLKVKPDPLIKNKQILVTIPEQIIKKYNYLIQYSSYLLSLY